MNNLKSFEDMMNESIRPDSIPEDIWQHKVFNLETKSFRGSSFEHKKAMFYKVWKIFIDNGYKAYRFTKDYELKEYATRPRYSKKLIAGTDYIDAETNLKEMYFIADHELERYNKIADLVKDIIKRAKNSIKKAEQILPATIKHDLYKDGSKEV